MRYRTTIATVAVVVCSAAAVFASGEDRTGTFGALELLLPTDARGAAMGGSLAAGATGVNAWFWNPAGAASVEGTELSVAHRQYIADLALSSIAVAKNAGNFGVIGLSAKVLGMNDEPVYTTSQPEGTGETFSSSFVVVGASFARALTDRVHFGLNSHLVAERIHRETATGVAFDAGFIYIPDLRGIRLAVVIKNLGPKMRFDGPDFDRDVSLGNSDQVDSRNGRTQSASFELPAFIQFGMSWEAYRSKRSRLDMVGSFQSNNFADDQFRVGGEWGYADQLFLRAGYASTSEQDDLFDMTLGAGLAVPLGRRGATLDYTWAPARVFDDNHYFSLRVEW